MVRYVQINIYIKYCKYHKEIKFSLECLWQKFSRFLYGKYRTCSYFKGLVSIKYHLPTVFIFTYSLYHHVM